MTLGSECCKVRESNRPVQVEQMRRKLLRNGQATRTCGGKRSPQCVATTRHEQRAGRAHAEKNLFSVLGSAGDLDDNCAA
jgi:hypothetical protein